jgi:small subunit ribosomal protein S9
MAKSGEKKTAKVPAKKPAKKVKEVKEVKEAKKKVAPAKPHEPPKPEAEAAEPQVREEAVLPAEVHAAPPAPVLAHKPKAKHAKAEEVFYAATGRRKTSIARVRLVPGKGNILVNERPLDDYLAHRASLNVIVQKPLILTDNLSKFDVSANVRGGGIASQAGALSLGISRALLVVNPDLRGKIKAEGLLSRDSRMKERKKYGRKKARKRFQYSKR